MLQVTVESASGIPKKKIGNPDPITTVLFRGEKSVSLIFIIFFCYAYALQ